MLEQLIDSKEVFIDYSNLLTGLAITGNSFKLIIKHHMVLRANVSSVEVAK